MKKPNFSLLNFLLLALLPLLLFSCEDYEGDLSGSANYALSSTGGQTSELPEPVGSGDNYNEIVENPFVDAAEEPVSTFSVDADGASWANARRFILDEGQLPPPNAVRTEEFINYFNLSYPFNAQQQPIALNGEVSACPWQEGHKLVRIGIQGRPMEESAMPASNFTFLIDVSGSMSSPDKLELLKTGFNMLVDELSANDRIAIVTYAGQAGVLLESTPGSQKQQIKNAINQLGAGGSTAGAAGIRTAYQIAGQNFIEGGNNRVIIGTDGDFNVGPSSQEELITLIEEEREKGVFLTVLGVGRGNLNDGALEQIANKGNGTYEYIDKVEQLKKVFVYEQNKFYTVAKDVKVQVEFNPDLVEAYRLIGYENRLLNEEDFEDDSKDAGEIGAGQNITALYEIKPKVNPAFRTVPSFTIDFRYKLPDSDSSQPLELQIFDKGRAFSEASDQLQFTASVAAFALLIRDSEYKGSTDYEKVLQWNSLSSLPDPHGFKAEFRQVVETAAGLQ